MPVDQSQRVLYHGCNHKEGGHDHGTHCHTKRIFERFSFVVGSYGDFILNVVDDPLVLLDAVMQVVDVCGDPGILIGLSCYCDFGNVDGNDLLLRKVVDLGFGDCFGGVIVSRVAFSGDVDLFDYVLDGLDEHETGSAGIFSMILITILGLFHEGDRPFDMLDKLLEKDYVCFDTDTSKAVNRVAKDKKLKCVKKYVQKINRKIVRGT